MIDKILAFGDSFMLGDELAIHEYSDRYQYLRDIAPDVILNSGGAVDLIKTSEQSIDIIRTRFSRMGPKDYIEKCHNHVLAGQLAAHLNVPYHNYAGQGYSNSAILSELILHKDEITSNTLVLVGLTSATRTTRYDNYNNNPQIYSVVSNLKSMSVKDDPGHQQYLMLDLTYGNDFLTKVMEVRNHICTVKHILANNQYLIIDPTSLFLDRNVRDIIRSHKNFRTTIEMIDDDDNVYPKRNDLISDLEQFFIDNIYHETLYEQAMLIRDSGKEYLAPFSHYNRDVHTAYMNNILIPELQQRGYL